MRIERIRLERFRRFQELDIELSPGLNVVRGPNEAGKSTLQTAIADLLFTDPGLKNREIDRMRPWGGETLPVLEAAFSSPAEDYDLSKDFENRRAELRLPSGTLIKDRGAWRRARARRRAAALWGSSATRVGARGRP